MRPRGWRGCTLGDLAVETGGFIQTGPFGSQLHASDYLPDGVPVIMPVNIGDNRLLERGVARVAEDDAARLARHRLRLGDIVYSRRGDVEKRALVREPQAGWLCGTGCLLVRVSGPHVDPTYVSYWLGHPEIRAWVTQHAIGATMPNLNTGILSALPVLLPPLVEQQGIAATLERLDEKVESNRRCVRLAVGLAQAQLLVGSEQVRLGDVATLDKGVSYKGSGLVDQPSTSARPLINLGNFPVDSSWLDRSKAKFYSGGFRDRHLVRAGDLVVANTDLTQQRAVLGRATLVPPALAPSLITHHVFAVRFHSRSELRLPLWAQLATPAARDRLIGFATGTTVAGLPKEALLDFFVSAPASGDGIAKAEALLNVAWAREQETSSLVALRDALLPELLSGRIRVPEASEASIKRSPHRKSARTLPDHDDITAGR